VHGRICAQCCGEQREVTLDCPSDCPYLQQAREHEKRRDFSGIDQSEFFPTVEIGEQFMYEREHLLFGLTFALAKSARANRSLVDRDLIVAVVSLAKGYEMLVNSSLIVEQRTTNLEHQAITAEIDQMLKEFREAEQKHLGVTRLRESEVLQALVFLVRLGLARTSGRPKSRSFVDFLLAQFPENPSAIAAPEDAGSRIIVP
jgi:hypothetical protein